MIAIAKTDDEIQNCYAVMAELRPHIKSGEFLPQVKKQTENSGYQLAYLTDGEVKAVGGFRISEWLSGGKFLEIENLVARSGERSKGYGGELFDWIVDFAKQEKCSQIKLVSHVKRFDAHRFYLNKRMIIQAHYFSMTL
ncbi:MAG: GNAT family N-acetyltransferase [Acidobacteriota bacterium]|nr:GNAT family N-acetyltransferase [Acidobacteriota bacterium]